ncbi:rod shape-determining protein RodA [Clostridiisalibacter paucivorans]|uniref:rod shape-determining protein RodA n=1 Tax=Clostridiisalibacter paucivorans TaxID=408753 RepID=UPI0004794B10|nr:rod shape-determining protein RodA [Clostridiisalibacter paucivorans]
MLNFEKKLLKKLDYKLIISIFLLNLCGFIAIYISTKSDSLSYIKMQSVAFFLGFIGMLFLTFFDYNNFGKFYMPIYIFCNLLLIAVLLFGTGKEQWGANSWIVIGKIRFQPSEIVKIGMILSMAKFIEKNKDKINEPLTLGKILLFAGIPILLVLQQPDFGTAIVFVFFTAVMLFIAGLDFKYYLYAFIGGVLSFPILWFKFFDRYQKKRILVFLDPSIDPSGAAYHVNQSKIAIGSGQLIGRLLSHQAKLVDSFFEGGWLPEKHTDFIFAVVGEAFGLAGGLLIIILYFTLIYRLVKISKNAKDLFGSLIAVGITSMMGFHIIQNIGMTMGLIPVTGIPLPFISYGGTFLLSNMASIGIVLSICIRKDKINF